MNLLYGLDLTREAHKQMFVKLEYFLPKFYLPGNAITAKHKTYVDITNHSSLKCCAKKNVCIKCIKRISSVLSLDFFRQKFRRNQG